MEVVDQRFPAHEAPEPTSPKFWDISPGFWDFANLDGTGQQLEVVIGSFEATTLHNVHYGTFILGCALKGLLSVLTLLGEFSRSWRKFSSKLAKFSYRWRMESGRDAEQYCST